MPTVSLFTSINNIAFSLQVAQITDMKKGTRVGCPQAQDRFLGFLRPQTPDLGLSKQVEGVSRKNCPFPLFPHSG
ncbi:hypothetical protein PMIT1327_01928 [Prochlorococcus marinus str. MIT 1327]|nr:hypothetical protein PMIT1312_02681 [Prochlorococcus marinus str. MIT 1312]KZR79865.1 hypothetical protein PMIT1327_01928 [Prochlorococcus marinus str. MIT 1327]